MKTNEKLTEKVNASLLGALLQSGNVPICCHSLHMAFAALTMGTISEFIILLEDLFSCYC